MRFRVDGKAPRSFGTDFLESLAANAIGKQKVASADGSQVWQGRVQYVYSNEVHEFDDWNALIAYVQDTAMHSGGVDGAKPGGADGPA